jgi:transaldolase / glucose-6-phosphate isomerase
MADTRARVNPRLQALTEAGTSIWLDQVRRDLVSSGELQRMVEEDCLRGVTSNPAIFEGAILGSPEYDDQLAELAREGVDNREIYRRIAVRDIQEACDVLRGVWDRSGGADGFVSLEVDPDIADDTDKTIAQARELWELVDRPNAMIKIPGTDAGLPAITQALFEGINVNVTLLFRVEQYVRVIDAYLDAMERRHEEGLPLDVHSVASFFVSRVDSAVDKLLPEDSDLRGKAGLANAREAYRRFKAVFHDGERFAALREAGCPVQRPLWASTGVKDPAYPDTLYVDGLAGPDTVNTMPLATLSAAAERAEVDPARPTVEEDPSRVLRALAEAGVDLDEVTESLLQEGLSKFVDPMEALLEGIDDKREAVVTQRPPAIGATLPDEIEPQVAARLEEAQRDEVVRRIWRRDDTVWGEAGAAEVADRLGWLTAPETYEDCLDALEAFAGEVRDEGFTDVVLLGMGGSSLAAEVVWQSFGPQAGRPRLHVLDTTDRAWVDRVQEAVDDPFFLVSTKSGGTIETLTGFEHFWAAYPEGRRFAAVTDPGSSLCDLAKERGFRRTFLNDPDIGGRYSALSYFGLVPAALMGADVRALVRGAQVAVQACTANEPRSNSGLWLGVVLGELALAGRDKLTLVVDPPLGAFGLWAEQLVAESTGKQGRGILPVAGEPLLEPGRYGEDRVFVHLRSEEDPHEGHAEALEALAEAGHPVVTLQARGPGDLGRIFFFAEFATAVAGWVLRINPFDQPDVQEAKDRTKAVLEAGDADLATGDAAALARGLRPPGYLAILGFLAEDDGVDAAVAELRRAVGERHRVATTFGYGPRYLHSTGQLHKGGPAGGRFLLLVHDGATDDTFTPLKHAQAAGDLGTLRDHGLPAEVVVLEGGDPAAAIRELAGVLAGEEA